MAFRLNTPISGGSMVLSRKLTSAIGWLSKVTASKSFG